MKNKRFLKITLIAAVVALLCAALFGCSLIQGILHPEGKFALSESEITLKIGETYDVTLSDGRTDEFTLSTSDKTKVEIYGRTSIKAVGKTQTAVTITATNGKTATAYVYDEGGNLISTTTLETIRSNGIGEVNDTIAAIGNEGTFTLKVVVGEISREVNFVVKDNVAANHIEVGVSGNLSQTTAELVTFTATLSPAKADVESVNGTSTTSIIRRARPFRLSRRTAENIR